MNPDYQKIESVIKYFQNKGLLIIEALKNERDYQYAAMINLNENLAPVVDVTNKAFAAISDIISDKNIENEYVQYFADSRFETIEELTISLVSYYEQKLTELMEVQPKELGFGMLGTLSLYINNVKKYISQQVEVFLSITKSADMIKITDYEDIEENTGWIFFDVETLGLTGEPFAFAYEVVNRKEVVIDRGFYYYHPDFALGEDDDRKWIMNNCFPTFDDPKYVDLKVEVAGINLLLDKFRKMWKKYNKGFTIVADCPYPCESNFLFLCELNPSPIPILDIASMLNLIGKDPVKTYSRLPEELPAHSPANDILQSKRLFFAILHGKYDDVK